MEQCIQNLKLALGTSDNDTYFLPKFDISRSPTLRIRR